MIKQILAATGIFLILAVLGIVFSVVSEKEGKKISEVLIGNAVFKVEIADNPSKRAQGLSGREFLDPDSGMLFVFPTSGIHGFWMKGMKFPLDILWIKDNKVLGMVLNARPDLAETPAIYNPPVAIDKVLEINGGKAQEFGIMVGDIIVIR